MTQISFMYLPQSNMEKWSQGMDKIYDMTQWDDQGVESELIKDGYAYFVIAEVQLKKKEITTLMQVLNPGFSSKIQVFYNPWASETASASVGGFKVAGGDERSYYVRKGDEKAYRLQKKNYKESFKKLFGDCDTMIKEHGEMRWSKFAEAMFHYDRCEM